MTLASALVGSSALPVQPWMAPYMLGQPPAPPPPQQPAAPRLAPTFVQTSPDSLAGALATSGSGNGGGAAPGSGPVPNDMLAQALVKNAKPTGPMYNALEPLGRLAELYAGNKGEQTYLQQRQKAVADFGNSFGGDPVTAGLNSPLPEIQDQALKMKMSMAYPTIGPPNPVSGWSTVTQGGRITGMLDPVGVLHPTGGTGAGGGGVPSGAGGDGGVQSPGATAPGGEGGGTPAVSTTGTQAQGAPDAQGINWAAPPVPGQPWQLGKGPGGGSVLKNFYTNDMKPGVDTNGPADALNASLLAQSAPWQIIRDAGAQAKANFLNNGDSGGPTSDMALGYAYLKAVNPTSGVRFGAEASTENTGLGLTDKFLTAYNNARHGDVMSPGLRRDMMATVVNNYQAAAKTQQATENNIYKVADARGIDRKLIPSQVNGFPAPDMPMPTPQELQAALPQALQILKSNPTDPDHIANFEKYYGPGSAAKALQVGPMQSQVPPPVPPVAPAPVQANPMINMGIR